MKVFSGIQSFFQDIGNIFGSRSVLGLDLGTSSIKIAELSQKKGTFRLDNYALLETSAYLDQPNHGLQASSMQISEQEGTRILQTALSNMKPKTKTALIAIPSFGAFVTLLDMPMLSEKETTQSVQFQARKYIPMPIEQVSVDWFKVDTYTSKQGQEFQRIMLVGIPKQTISTYQAICKNAGLRLAAMELDSAALARALPPFSEPTLVVDIGALSTGILVTESGVVKHTSQTDYSGIHVTRALSKSLDLSMRRSEVLKRRRGLEGPSEGQELSTLITPFLDVIIQEVDYARSTYERRYAKKVTQFYIVGGGAELKGITEYMAYQLNLRHTPATIFEHIRYNTALEPAMPSLEKQLPIAIGLAERYFLS